MREGVTGLEAEFFNAAAVKGVSFANSNLSYASMLGASIQGGTHRCSSGEGPGPNEPTGPIDTVLVGANLALLIVGVLGALWAKVLVFIAALLPVVLVALSVAFFAGMRMLSAADLPTNALSDDGVIRVLLGTARYLVGIGVGGVVLGILLRSTAGSIGVLIGGVLFAPALAGALLPDSWDSALQYLPSNAGAAFTTLLPQPGMLGAAAGAFVLCAWLIAGLAGDAFALRTRDAWAGHRDMAIMLFMGLAEFIEPLAYTWFDGDAPQNRLALIQGRPDDLSAVWMDCAQESPRT